MNTTEIFLLAMMSIRCAAYLALQGGVKSANGAAVLAFLRRTLLPFEVQTKYTCTK